MNRYSSSSVDISLGFSSALDGKCILTSIRYLKVAFEDVLQLLARFTVQQLEEVALAFEEVVVVALLHKALDAP